MTCGNTWLTGSGTWAGRALVDRELYLSKS